MFCLFSSLIDRYILESLHHLATQECLFNTLKCVQLYDGLKIRHHNYTFKLTLTVFNKALFSPVFVQVKNNQKRKKKGELYGMEIITW